MPTKMSAIRSESCVSGWRLPRGCRSAGSVTSSLLREDPLVALRGQHRVALVVGGLDPLAGLVDALPGVGLRLWGSAPISRRATSTGERSPTQVGRLERGERLERAGAGEGRRGVGARGVEGLRVEGGDLLGVGESLVPDIAALELLTRSSRS